MKRLALSLLMLLIAPAYAAGPSMVGTQLYPTGAHSYTGPGDIVAFSFWCGLRAYSSATAGTNAIQLRRASDSTTTNIATITTPGPTFGNLDTATATTFCNATTCFIRTCYDQTGGGHDLVQTASGSQPGFTLNCVNTTLPCIHNARNTEIMKSAASVTPATGVVSVTAVLDRVSGTGAVPHLCPATNCGGTELNSTSSASTIQVSATGFLNGTATDNAWHSIIGIVNGASSVMRVDSTETTGSVTGAITAGSINAFDGNCCVSTTVNYGEVGFQDASVWSSGTRASIQANQKAYWGTP